MPTLGKEKAKQVEGAESTSFDAVPEDRYVGELKDVQVKEGKKADYWSWEFRIVEPAEFENRKLWVNTSLSDAADWKMQEMFKAFGVPATTDTDELIGQLVIMIVEQAEIENGARKGQIGNNVTECLPYDGELGGDDSAW